MSKSFSVIEERVISVVRNTIANCMDVTEEFPTAPSQVKDIVAARYFMVVFLHQLLPELTLAQIGSVFNKNHVFSLHAIKTVANWKDTSADYRKTYSKLNDAITPRYLSVLMNAGAIGKVLPRNFVAFDEIVRKNPNMQHFYENVYNQNQLIEAVAKKIWHDLHANPKTRAGDFRNYFSTLFDIDGVFKISEQTEPQSDSSKLRKNVKSNPAANH